VSFHTLPLLFFNLCPSFLTLSCYLLLRPRERWHSAIVAYNVNDRKSFENAEEYLEAIKQAAPQGVFTMALVGTQTDLGEEEREVTQEEGRALALKHEVPFYETSAKTGEGLKELFGGVATSLIQMQKE
jgi:Ras-related protein Rab-5C